MVENREGKRGPPHLSRDSQELSVRAQASARAALGRQNRVMEVASMKFNRVGAILTMAAFVFLAPRVLAQRLAPEPRYFTGNELYAECTSAHESGTNDEFECLGYVNGAAEVLDGLGIVSLPNPVTLRQEVDVVVQYLQKNPALRGRRASLLVLTALYQAFPGPNYGALRELLEHPQKKTL